MLLRCLRRQVWQHRGRLYHGNDGRLACLFTVIGARCGDDIGDAALEARFAVVVWQVTTAATPTSRDEETYAIVFASLFGRDRLFVVKKAPNRVIQIDLDRRQKAREQLFT